MIIRRSSSRKEARRLTMLAKHPPGAPIQPAHDHPIPRWGWLSLLGTLLLGALIWGVVAYGCMMVASTGWGWPSAGAFPFRLEIVLLSSLVGAGLGAAGATYQAVLRNPLADPYLLGVSTGAALLAYIWRLPSMTHLTLSLGWHGQAISQEAFAFVGAIASVAIVLLISNRRGRLEPITLLLVGVIVNAINGSIFLLVYSLSGSLPNSEGALSLLIAGIQTGLSPQQKWTATIIIGIGFVLLMSISGQLNAAGVSDAEAEALGVRIQRLRWVALVIASLVTAASVAISGPIGFIGLICPHLARLIVGTDQRRMLPLATAIGAALLALADAGSRRLAGEGLAQTLLPVSVLTSLFGGPFFLLLLIQSRRRVLVGEGIS
jgi:iron complex transport system permease protein